jgi:hypothetical protein
MSEVPPWYSTYDDDQRGYIVNRGLDKLDQNAALQATIKAHREAEGKLGIPADQVLRLPKDPADPAMGDVWKRLGAPETKEGYTFDAVKFKDGSALEPEDQAFVRDLAAELRLPVAHAQKIAERFAARTEAMLEAESVASRTAAGAEEAILRQNWGTTYDVNLFHATKAVEALGLPKEMFDVIKGQVGYAKAMDTFKTLGQRMGEAAFLGGDGQSRIPGADTLSRDQALDRKAMLMKDQDFGKRWVNGDAAAVKEMADLDRILSTRAR